jgi:radical SAM superfamily enzyme YgiQ (UPF0313 family)
MNKILIYNFSGELEDMSHLFPNERLAIIAAILKKYGKEVDIIDRANLNTLINLGLGFMQNLGSLNFYDTNEWYEEGLQKEAEYLLANSYDTIFINLWHGSGFKFSINLAGYIKQRNPRLKIYGIGPQVDWYKEHILRISNHCLDGLIVGLGYNAVDFLMQGRAAESVPNLIFRSNEEIKFARLSPIDLDDYPTGVYTRDIYRDIDFKVPVYPLSLTNQACANACVFCVRPENYGRVVYKRDIGRVIDELKHLFYDHKVAYFRLSDSTPPKNHLTEISRALISSSLAGKIKLSGFARIDENSHEDFSLLKQAGFVSLFFGIESLDENNLLRLKKGINVKIITSTLKKAHDAGIHTIGSFIFPIPGETTQSMNTTLKRIGELRPYLDSLVALPAGVYPPTEWGKHPEKYGIAMDPDYIEKCVTYPIKYLIPLKHWKPFPFKYTVMDKSLEEVDSQYVMSLTQEFVERIRSEYAIPGIPDYYFLLADLLGRDYREVTQEIVSHLIQRNYEGIKRLFIKTEQ